MATPQRVLVVDDHQVFADLLTLALNSADDFVCVKACNSVAAAQDAIAVTPFDIAIVDVQLPDGDGLTVAREALRIRPVPRVFVLTAYPKPETARQAEELGVSAMITKDGSLPNLLSALRTATPAHPVMPDLPACEIRLTPRELEVLQLLSTGSNPRTIARTLGISPHTSRDHVKNILSKFGATSQLDAVVAASRAGLISL